MTAAAAALNYIPDGYSITSANSSISSVGGEAQVVIETWRREYNEFRPHSSWGYRPPAPEAVLPAGTAYATLRLPQLADGRAFRLT